MYVSLAPMPPHYFSFLFMYCEQFFPTIVTKTMNLDVMSFLEFVATIYCNFNFWMSRGGVDTFALVINYLDETCTPKHANVGLFEVHEAINSAMVLQLQVLLKKIGLIHHVFAFVKDEGNKLGTMVVELWSIVDCELLNLFQVFEDVCFGHVISKVC